MDSGTCSRAVPVPEMPWTAAVATHTGKIRSHNEDAVLERSADHLWVVADGMGGHEAGEVASTRLVDHLREVAFAAQPADMLDRVEDVIDLVNSELLEYSRATLNGRTVGCTVVVMSIAGPLGWVLWAGDCRLYRARDGVLTILTEDHTRVAELLRDGTISSQTARQYSANVVTRAVGVTADLRLDCAIFPVQSQDRFLLCSDGLYNSLPHGEIVRHMTGRVPHGAADAMLQVCLEGEAKDNVSLIVIWQGKP